MSQVGSRTYDVDDSGAAMVSGGGEGADAVDVADPDGEAEVGGREAATSFADGEYTPPAGPLVEVHSGWMKKRGQGAALVGGKMQKR